MHGCQVGFVLLSGKLNWNYVSQNFLPCISLPRIDDKRNLYSIWKVEIKHLPFLGLRVRVKLDAVVAQEPCHQSTGSRCWYTIVGPLASSMSLFSAFLTTESVEMAPYPPACYSDH